MGYIDLHCDTLMKGYFQDLDDIYSMKDTMINIEKLKAGGASAQFFAVFFPPRTGNRWHDAIRPMPEDLEYFAGMRELLLSTVAKHSDELALAGNFADLQANEAAGKISAFLTMEDGRAVQGSMDRLIDFYNKGVRLISLTWNFENCFGFPNSPDPELMKLGLKPFGKEAIECMNELGMLIDVSHLSDGGFYDIAEISKKPFVASHSNARELSPHPRNLTDDMIRTLGECGGVAGLNFNGPFLQKDITSDVSDVDRMVEHVLYLLNKGGEDLIAIGTDFDGIGGKLEISNASEMDRLYTALVKAGLTPRQMDKFWHDNAARVIKEAL